MSDLIERLREAARDYVDCGGHCDLELEAAEEIERLLMLGKIQANRLNEALVEIERLTGQVAYLAEENIGYVAQLNEALRRIANLEAELAEWIDWCDPDKDCPYPSLR